MFYFTSNESKICESLTFLNKLQEKTFSRYSFFFFRCTCIYQMQNNMYYYYQIFYYNIIQINFLIYHIILHFIYNVKEYYITVIKNIIIINPTFTFFLTPIKLRISNLVPVNHLNVLLNRLLTFWPIYSDALQKVNCKL